MKHSLFVFLILLEGWDEEVQITRCFQIILCARCLLRRRHQLRPCLSQRLLLNEESLIFGLRCQGKKLRIFGISVLAVSEL